MNDHQILSTCNELVDSVKDVFPKHAEFSSWIDHQRSAYICNICWKLNNDKNRPNKPSRTILVIISRELIEDTNFEHRQQIVRARFKIFVQKKIRQI